MSLGTGLTFQMTCVIPGLLSLLPFLISGCEISLAVMAAMFSVFSDIIDSNSLDL